MLCGSVVAAFWLRFGCANPSQACNAMHGSVQPLRQTAPLQHRAQRGQQVAPDPRLTGPGAHWLSRYLQGLRNVGRLPCANGLRGAHILQQHVVFKVQIKAVQIQIGRSNQAVLPIHNEYQRPQTNINRDCHRGTERVLPA